MPSLKGYLETLKNMFNGKRKTQNLVLLLVLLVILLLVSKYILKEEEAVNVQPTLSNSNEVTHSLEERLEYILCQIEGITNVSVMVTYASTSKIIPVYDVKQDSNETETSTQKTIKNTTEKTVAYQEKEGSRVPIVESTMQAQPLGAIVVAEGVIDSDKIMEIKEAIAGVCQIPVHKISVFNK